MNTLYLSVIKKLLSEKKILVSSYEEEQAEELSVIMNIKHLLDIFLKKEREDIILFRAIEIALQRELHIKRTFPEYYYSISSSSLYNLLLKLYDFHDNFKEYIQFDNTNEEFPPISVSSSALLLFEALFDNDFFIKEKPLLLELHKRIQEIVSIGEKEVFLTIFYD